MKPIEKAALIAGAVGVAGGLAIAWALPAAAWWIYVAGGAALAGGMFAAASKDIEAKQAAKGE